MKQDRYTYRIFDCIVESSLKLPELPPVHTRFQSDTKNITVRYIQPPHTQRVHPEWFHHWYLPDGRTSLSCGKTDNSYFLRFPALADFELSVTNSVITCYPAQGVTEFTMRHLLLDQVIPRLLSHQGQLILHASAVRFNSEALLFLGETGQGKSTLAMALQQHGCSILTDDCVSLKLTDRQASCIPNYIGARLWPDSLAAFNPGHDRHTSSKGDKKERVFFPLEQHTELLQLPVKALFFLSPSNKKSSTNPCSILPVSGPAKFIEMNKHCFPLDITDQVSTRTRFLNMARLGKISNILFARLQYPREYALLPDICRSIVKACAVPPAGDKEEA